MLGMIGKEHWASPTSWPITELDARVTTKALPGPGFCPMRPGAPSTDSWCRAWSTGSRFYPYRAECQLGLMNDTFVHKNAKDHCPLSLLKGKCTILLAWRKITATASFPSKIVPVFIHSCIFLLRKQSLHIRRINA